jgi:hypothetical protein
MTIILYPAGGGLGNLLYQHHAIYALGKQYQCPIYIYIDYPDCRPNIYTYLTLFKHINFINTSDANKLLENKNCIHYNELEFMYNNIELDINTNTIYIVKGYYQSYKYFEPYIYELGQLLKNNEIELYNKMILKYNNIIKESHSNFETVCCHIRRGDYLTSGTYYTILSEEYYEKALEHFKEIDKYKVLVFAEDINEIKDWAVWKKYNIHFVDDEPLPLPTIFLMSLCDHFIIANSSLSVNAYYMNNKFSNDTQKIIAPSQWFGATGSKYNIYDIVPERSIVI